MKSKIGPGKNGEVYGAEEPTFGEVWLEPLFQDLVGVSLIAQEVQYANYYKAGYDGYEDLEGMIDSFGIFLIWGLGIGDSRIFENHMFAAVTEEFLGRGTQLFGGSYQQIKFGINMYVYTHHICNIFIYIYII